MTTDHPRVTISVPSVRYPGPDDTDAGFYRIAADKLRRGMEPGGSNLRDAIAELLDRVANALEPGVEPEMDEAARMYYTAARDDTGGIRLRSGLGMLVASRKNTRADIQGWHDRALEMVPRNAGTADPWYWVRQYRAALELLDREAQA